MRNIITSVFALALVGAAAMPAAAAVNSGDFLITVTGGHGVPKGYSFCATLTQTGGVLGFANSGTVSVQGTTGNYYAINSNLTAEVGNVFFTGHLYDKGISNAALTVFSDSGIVGIGSFTATHGCP
jgi:hypothetical protein